MTVTQASSFSWPAVIHFNKNDQGLTDVTKHAVILFVQLARDMQTLWFRFVELTEMLVVCF